MLGIDTKRQNTVDSFSYFVEDSPKSESEPEPEDPVEKSSDLPEVIPMPGPKITVDPEPEPEPEVSDDKIAMSVLYGELTDLNTEIQEELTELKTEIKGESRQFKGALRSFKEIFGTLQKSHDVLTKELNHRRQEQKVETEIQKQAILKPFLLDIIELRDRLEAGVLHSKNYRSGWLARIFQRESAFVASLSQGQDMMLRRVDQLLSSHDVQAINAIGKSFDPKFMRAVAVEYSPGLPNNEVILELRKGFIWKDEILRVAEVKVNKEEELN
ncbi:MAG: nucleotide exchange factor GrpE [Pseudomonadota bacterium]